ncbi:MAG: hypothetical protein C0483_06490 [Pirellula sp.]|nr:hypothetical protein [Pirellula sp.]
MDRVWLLTNSTYGTRLPGDHRGFVGRVTDHRSLDPPDHRVIHNVPGTTVDEDAPELEERSREIMRGPPIYLARDHALEMLAQFWETATQRSWRIFAAAAMDNHFHIVIGVLGDPSPGKILGDLKSWATRRLTRVFGKPASETWWTERGSKRKLPDDAAVTAAMRYVLYEQPEPLLAWSEATGVCFDVPPK